MNRLLALSHVALGIKMTHQLRARSDGKKVTYISNLEGDLDQLVLSLMESDMNITWHGDHKLETECGAPVQRPHGDVPCWPKLSLPPGDDQLVFGGNLFDHGKGDIRLANMFIKLYEECKKTPKDDFKFMCDENDDDKGEDKLYYILGNRDILKMRYAVAIEKDLKAATWNTDVKNLTGTQASMRKEQLHSTSGARESFEFRRAEIDLLGLDEDGNVEDHEVADSFKWMTGVNAPTDLADSFKWMTGQNPPTDAASPMAGLYKDYLKLADLIVKIDGTIYTHGAITKDNFLQSPTTLKFGNFKTETAATEHEANATVIFKPSKSVDEWIQKVRQLDDDMIDAWAHAIEQKQDMDVLYPGRLLLTYMMAHFSEEKKVENEKTENEKTEKEETVKIYKGVVESSMMIPKTFDLNPEVIDGLDGVAAQLNAEGIKRVVGGFRSPGAKPQAVKVKETVFWNANMNIDTFDKFGSKARMSLNEMWARLEIKDNVVTAVGSVVKDSIYYEKLNELSPA